MKSSWCPKQAPSVGWPKCVCVCVRFGWPAGWNSAHINLCASVLGPGCSCCPVEKGPFHLPSCLKVFSLWPGWLERRAGHGMTNRAPASPSHVGVWPSNALHMTGMGRAQGGERELYLSNPGAAALSCLGQGRGRGLSLSSHPSMPSGPSSNPWQAPSTSAWGLPLSCSCSPPHPHTD